MKLEFAKDDSKCMEHKLRGQDIDHLYILLLTLINFSRVENGCTASFKSVK